MEVKSLQRLMRKMSSKTIWVPLLMASAILLHSQVFGINLDEVMNEADSEVAFDYSPQENQYDDLQDEAYGNMMEDANEYDNDELVDEEDAEDDETSIIGNNSADSFLQMDDPYDEEMGEEGDEEEDDFDEEDVKDEEYGDEFTESDVNENTDSLQIRDPYLATSFLELRQEKAKQIKEHKHLLDQTEAEDTMLQQATPFSSGKMPNAVLSPTSNLEMQSDTEGENSYEGAEYESGEVADVQPQYNMLDRGEDSPNNTPEDIYEREVAQNPVNEPFNTAVSNGSLSSDASDSASSNDFEAATEYKENDPADMAVELQNSEPEIEDSFPHEVEGRHSWNDIKLTEALRISKQKGEIKESSANAYYGVGYTCLLVFATALLSITF